MSFVKKAVKKVFKFGKKLINKGVKFVKRVVKSDWFKVAAIIALSVFTAGLASPLGFSAFTGVETLGGFLSAVGTTMSAGFTSITGALSKAGSSLGSIFTGNTPAAATMSASNALTEVAVTGAFKAGGTVTAAEMAGLSMSQLAVGAATGGTFVGSAAPAAGGWLSKLGTFASTNSGKYLMGQAVVGGIQSYYADKRAEVQEGYYRNRNIWGNAAYGGPADNPMDIMMPQFAKSSSVTGAAEQGLLPFERQQAADAEAAAAQEPAEIQRGGLLSPEGQQQGQNPQQSAGPGVPGQQTQPPPATQPQNAPTPPPGSQLENMGV